MKWHLRQAQRDPVATAQPREPAQEKKNRATTTDGLEPHSLAIPMQALATHNRSQFHLRDETQEQTVERLAKPTPLQVRALNLVQSFPVDIPSDS